MKHTGNYTILLFTWFCHRWFARLNYRFSLYLLSLSFSGGFGKVLLKWVLGNILVVNWTKEFGSRWSWHKSGKNAVNKLKIDLLVWPIFKMKCLYTCMCLCIGGGNWVTRFLCKFILRVHVWISRCFVC